MTGRDLTWAGWHFSAAHSAAARPILHGHSYEVRAFWPYEGQDAEDLQERLKAALATLDHQTLPPGLSRQEDIARHIGLLLPGCVRVDVSRPLERLGCEVWLS